VNEYNILDYEDRVSSLSDMQLVGIVLEKVRYPERLIILTQHEIQKRKLTKKEIEKLEERYLEIEKVDIYKIKIHWLVVCAGVLVLLETFLLQVVAISLPKIFVGLTMVFTSLYAIKVKFEEGRKNEMKIWRNFKLFYLILIIMTIIVSFMIL